MKRILFLLKSIANSLGLRKNRIVTPEELRQYLETYLHIYRLSVELGIPFSKYKQYFELYSINPLNVKATISNLLGVSIEYKNGPKKTINVKKTEERIENYLFSKKKPLTKNLAKTLQQYPRFNNKKHNKTPFLVGPKYVHWENIVFNTSKANLLDLSKADSNVTFKNIYVNNVHYPNILEVFENNRFSNWTIKKAIKAARAKFLNDLKTAYLNSHEFRKLMASPKLHKLADKIAVKEKSGGYGGVFGTIKFESDIEQLYKKSAELKISNEFTKLILENQRKKANLPSWPARNPVVTGISVGLIVYGITEFIDLKSLWDWILTILK